MAKKINLPNALLISRFIMAIAIAVVLLLIPYFPTWTHQVGTVHVNNLNFIALSLFLVASFTDFLDGYLARKWNQVTTFGKIFDPIADKLLINIVLIIFAVQTRIPVWLVIIFVTRDLLVDGLRVKASKEQRVIPASMHGKLKTVMQMIGLSLLFIQWPQTTSGSFNYNALNHLYLIPLYMAAVTSVTSGVIYYKEYSK